MSRSDDGASYEELARKVAELRAENTRLCELLGLGARPSGGHEVAWAPTLLVEPSRQRSIDATAEDAEKLALFQSLFGARSDVNATRWENASTGKGGMVPGDEGWVVEAAGGQGLPAVDRRGVPRPLGWRVGSRHLPSSSR